MFLWRRCCGDIRLISPAPNSIPFSTARSLTTTSSSIDPTDATPSVSLSFHENSSVAILTLCNPRRRNALTVSMMEDLDRHVHRLAKWSTGGTDGGSRKTQHDESEQTKDDNGNARAVILTGSNNTFCSGLDLRDIEQSDSENDGDCPNSDTTARSLKEGQNMIRHMTRVTNRLMSLPVLSVSAIDGYAIGGGAELTTCTDMVVLSRGARIQFVHARRGASPGWGGLRRLVKRVGRGRALRMLLLGECVSGEEEARAGGGTYADAVGEEGETALDAAMRLVVDPVLELPCSGSIRAIKRAVSAADGDGEVIESTNGRLKLDANLAMKGEFESFLSVWGGDSNREQIQKTKERLKEKDKTE